MNLVRSKVTASLRENVCFKFRLSYLAISTKYFVEYWFQIIYYTTRNTNNILERKVIIVTILEGGIVYSIYRIIAAQFV